jgi:hypothetical protein
MTVAIGIAFGATVLAACCGFSLGNLGMFREQWCIWRSQQPHQPNDVQ